MYSVKNYKHGSIVYMGSIEVHERNYEVTISPPEAVFLFTETQSNSNPLGYFVNNPIVNIRRMQVKP